MADKHGISTAELRHLLLKQIEQIERQVGYLYKEQRQLRKWLDEIPTEVVDG